MKKLIAMRFLDEPPPQPRVLIVEDDHDLLDVLLGVLTDGGYQVAAVWNGQAALDLVADGWHPDLILMDLHMPIMDGETAIACLGKNAATRLIPVVAMSAGASLRRADLGHATALLPKPFDLDSLLATVAKYLPKEGRGAPVPGDHKRLDHHDGVSATLPTAGRAGAIRPPSFAPLDDRRRVRVTP